MSYTILYAIKDNKTEEIGEYQNSHLGAPTIWDYICQKYLNWKGFPMFDESKVDSFWDCWKRDGIYMLPSDKVVLLSTYTYAYVKRENVGKLIKRFSELDKDLINRTHIAGYVKDMSKHTDADGFCWNVSTLSDDCWVDYDFSKRNDHWELFEEMSK